MYVFTHFLLVFMPRCHPLTQHTRGAMKPIEFIRRDGLSLLRLGGFCLVLFGPLDLEKARSYLEAAQADPWRGPCHKELWPPAYWKHVFQP